MKQCIQSAGDLIKAQIKPDQALQIEQELQKRHRDFNAHWELK